jgi:hypothetical protein
MAFQFPEVRAETGTITTQNLVSGGVATAGSAVLIYTHGRPTVSVQVVGTYTGALTAQATIDGVVWVSLSGLLNVNTGAFAATITSAAQGIYQVEAAGFRAVRITGLSAMTGTAIITLVAAQAPAMMALDAPLPAGTAVIGALTANQAVNVAQMNGVTVTMGNGTSGTGVQRVAIASDNTAFNVINTPVAPTTSFVNSAATTNATSTKSSAGTVWNVHVSNINAAVRYLKLYNKASAPTVGTDVPVLTLPLPIGGVATLNLGSNGLRFTTGIAWALTTGSADSDTGAVAANEHKVAISYT